MSLLHAIRSRRGYFLAAGIVVVVDQASKAAAHALLRDAGPVIVVPGIFNLWYSTNRGGLFGYFSDWPDPWRSILLTLFPLLAIGLIAAFLARSDEPRRSTLAGLALILGGAVGNLIDRVTRGAVVDFLDVYASWPPLAEWLSSRFGTAHWPTFNLADSAIVTGAGLLLLDIVRPERPSERAPDGGAGRGV